MSITIMSVFNRINNKLLYLSYCNKKRVFNIKQIHSAIKLNDSKVETESFEDIPNIKVETESFQDISNIKFAIIMPTFNRSNGKSISYLNRSLDSIIKQKHKYWDIILVGDKFEPESLIIDLVNSYQSNLNNNKIIYINNTKVERDYIKNKEILWYYAGATSVNIGLEYTRNNNYKYYCHLDDDDYWSDTHLLVLAKIYNQYPNCIFANTQSTYINSFLPNEKYTLYENNRLPLSGKTIHSSISFRIDILPFYYTTRFEDIRLEKPSDALLLDEIKKFLENNKNYSSIYIPVLSCFHDLEGELLL